MAKAAPVAGPQEKSCSFCGRSGLVWFKTKAGRWMLAEPKVGSLEPDPHKVHACPVRAMEKALRKVSNGSVGRNGTRSYKPSIWKRGKGPSSYG